MINRQPWNHSSACFVFVWSREPFRMICFRVVSCLLPTCFRSLRLPQNRLVHPPHASAIPSNKERHPEISVLNYVILCPGFCVNSIYVSDHRPKFIWDNPFSLVPSCTLWSDWLHLGDLVGVSWSDAIKHLFFRTRRTRKELRPAQTFDTMSLRLISERLCLMDDENTQIEKLFDRWKEQADWITKDCR